MRAAPLTRFVATDLSVDVENFINRWRDAILPIVGDAFRRLGLS